MASRPRGRPKASADPPGVDAAFRSALPRITLVLWRRFGVPREHAEDAVQDVMLRLLNRFRAGDSLELLAPGAQTHLENYLAKAAYRRALDLARAARRQVALLQDLSELEDSGAHGYPGAGGIDPEQVWGAVRQLSPRYRAIFELKLEEDLSLVEIARRLGRKPETVHVQYHRGLKQLRELLPSFELL
jgi:RNA polymerase sigma factor (sigma-70 family)